MKPAQKKQESKSQKEQNLTVRKGKYIKYLSKYPLYCTLLVLKDYEDEEMYEECHVIKSALDDYNEILIKGTIDNKIQDEDIFLPTHLRGYHSAKFQRILEKYDIDVEDAKKKARLIKLNIPVK